MVAYRTLKVFNPMALKLGGCVVCYLVVKILSCFVSCGWCFASREVAWCDIV